MYAKVFITFITSKCFGHFNICFHGLETVKFCLVHALQGHITLPKLMFLSGKNY